MFEEPATKRVRRSELRSPSRSQSPTNYDDDTTQEALRAKLRSAIELDIVDITATTVSETKTLPPTEDQAEEDENTFAFKLFAPAPTVQPSAASTLQPAEAYSNTASSRTEKAAPTPTQPHPQRIQLITLDDANTETGATPYPIPQRPLSYYIAPPASNAAKARFKAAALETKDVLRLAKIERRGLACPWRVLHLPITLSAAMRSASPSLATPQLDADILREAPLETQTAAPTEHRKRTRKSKKTRIKLRQKLAKRAENEKRRKEAERAKEEHVREKKTRMNRAKQLRKREKARLAKEGGAGGGSGGGGGESDDE